MPKFNTYESTGAVFVLPATFPQAAAAYVERAVVLDCGGFTASHAIGAWRDEFGKAGYATEDVIVYRCAGLSFAALETIAAVVLANGVDDFYVEYEGKPGWFNRD